MHKGVLDRSHRLTWLCRPVCFYMALVAILTISVWFGGCSDKKEVPTFATPPVPEIQTWLYDVWGSSANDIFVVGQPGIVLHYDGSGWRQMSVPTNVPLIEVWGRSSNEVYACGHRGVILRYNGSSWSTMASGTSENLYGIGSYRGEVYCVGHKGTLLRLSGSSWVNTSTFIIRRTPSGSPLDTLDRNDDINSLTTVTHYGIGGSDGIVLMKDPIDTNIEWIVRLVAAGMEFVLDGHSNDVTLGSNYLVTSGGRIFRLQESTNALELSWLELSGLAPESKAINGIWADTGDTLGDILHLATRDGKVYQRENTGVKFPPSHDGSDVLYGIWGSASDNIYAVGINATVIRFDGISWEKVDVGLSTKAAAEMIVYDKFGRLLY